MTKQLPSTLHARALLAKLMRWSVGAALCGAAMSASAVDNVTAVWGSYNNNTWTATTANATTATPANGVNNLLAFTAGGVRYSTGVNDGALTGTFTAASFQAFIPNAASVPATAGYNAIPQSGTYDSTKTRAAYLYDGANGLDLNTALFNIPASALKFDVTVSNAAAATDSIPDVLVTQVGQPSASNLDRFYFIDSSNAIVGNAVTVSFSSVAVTARQNWQFWNPNHTRQSSLDGPRDLRMRAYGFADFGINASNIGNIVGFVQIPSGDSDIAFVAYNRLAVTTPASVSVVKTNNVNTLVAGSTTTYNVTLTNSGGLPATDVQWTDSASNLTVLGISPPSSVGNGSVAGTCTGMVCSGITLAPGASLTYTVTATVSQNVGAAATNTATVHGANCTNGAPVLSCTSVDNDPIVVNGALSITKTNNVDKLSAGTQTTYLVTLTNTGSSTSSNLTWTDTPSAGLTLVNVIPGAAPSAGANVGTCTFTSTLATCSGITLPSQQSITYSVVATVGGGVTPGGTVFNTAKIGNAACAPLPAADCSRDIDTILKPANLNITKTNGVNQVVFGSSTTYTVTLSNTGETAATGVQWTDTATGVSVSQITDTAVGPNSNEGLCVASGCSNITLAPGESITYSVLATVNGAAGVGNAKNTAAFPSGTSCTGTNQCTATDTDDILKPATLSVTKSNGVTQLTEGTSTTYTVTIANSGDLAAAGVEWTDVPTGMTIQSITPGSTTGTGAVAGTCGVTSPLGCTGITVPPASAGVNGSVSYTVTAQVTAMVSPTVTSVNNVASVTGANCTTLSPCTATDTDTLLTPTHFTVVKTAPETVITGASLSYSFTLGNSGQTAAAAGQIVTVREELPPGVAYVGATAGTGVSAVSCTGASPSLVCSVTLSSALAQNATASFTLQTTAPAAAGSITNYASVDPSGGTTPPAPGTLCAPTDACTFATTQINTPAALSVTKSNGVTQLTEGASTTYTVIITNSGDTSAAGVEWTDVPTGMTILSITPGNTTGTGAVVGTCGVTSPLGCTGITVPPASAGVNGSVSYTVTAQVTALVSPTVTSVNNVASVTGANCSTTSPCTATDTDTLLTPTYFTVVKTAPETVITGASLSYSFTLGNSGQTSAAAAAGQVVTVREELPPGVAYVGATAGAGVTSVSCTGAAPSLVCSVTLSSALAQNATASFTLQTTAPAAAGLITNHASVDPSGGTTPPVPGTLCAPDSACTFATTQINTPAALSVTKSNGVTQLTEGVGATYTVIITNSGDTLAAGVEWTDVPTGMTIQSILPNGSTGTGAVTGTCSVTPTLGCTGITVPAASAGVNGSVSYTVTAQVTALVSPMVTSVNNVASVTGANCSTTSPCTATDTDTLLTPTHFTVLKTAPDTVITGASLNYSFTLGNSGQTSAAAGQIVTVREELPPGVAYVGATAGTGVSAVSCTGTAPSLVCMVTLNSALVQNATASFTLQTTAPAAAGSITNYASVDPSGGTTPPAPGTLCAPTDACTFATTQINTPAALSVTKTNGVTQLTEGASTTYIVTITNSGDTPAAGVEWTDVPTGMTIQSITPGSTTGAGAVSGSCSVTPTLGCTGITVPAASAGVNGSVSYTVTAQVTAMVSPTVTSVNNVASVLGANCSSLSPCAATDMDVLLTPTYFTVVKTAPETVITGASLNYSFTLGNSGQTSAAAGQVVTVREELPPGVAYVGATAGTGVSAVSCTGASPSLVCSVTLSSALAQNATANFTLQTTAPAAAGSITNHASVDPSGGTTPPAPGTLCAPTDACTFATTQINTPAALSVTKSNGVDQVQADSETVYLVTLSNTGGTDVSNLQWSDVASGMTVTAIEPRTVGANSAAGACNAGGCSGVKLGAGESIVYAVTATVTAAAKTTITNTANLSGGANCMAAGDCFSQDQDTVTAVPSTSVTPVPVDSRTMLVLLGLALLVAAWRSGLVRKGR